MPKTLGFILTILGGWFGGFFTVLKLSPHKAATMWGHWFFCVNGFFLVCLLTKCHSQNSPTHIAYNSSHVGFWEGDFWIPPNGQIYDMQMMFDILKDRQILVFGDSLGRRMSSSLTFLLQKYHGDTEEDISAAEIDKDATVSMQIIGHGNHVFEVPIRGLTFEWSPLLANVVEKSCAVEHPVSPTVSDVVIDIGIHDSERPLAGRNIKQLRYEEYLNGTHSALTCLTRAPQRRVFWRTAPYAYFGGTDVDRIRTMVIEEETQIFNRAARTACSRFPRCTIVDAELLLRHKSVGPDRLAGDSPEHFGSVARLAMIQLLLRAMKLTAR